MKVAALDLGTNSFLCLVAEGDKSGIQRVLSDQVKVVRLGQDINKTGKFHPMALKRAKECLSEFKKEIDRHQVDRILAMATSAARDAQNGNELFRIGEELGIPIEIIPGDAEARITFVGATQGELKDKGNVLVVDVGGGSTELISGNKAKILFSKSLNIGCVRLTEKVITAQPIPDSERTALTSYIDKEIFAILPHIISTDIDEVIAVAGTPSALAAASLGGFDSKKIQGYILSEALLREWCDKLANTSVNEKITQLHIEEGRADVIYVGALILHRLLLHIKKDSMKVSIKGVRYGVAMEALSRP